MKMSVISILASMATVLTFLQTMSVLVTPVIMENCVSSTNVNPVPAKMEELVNLIPLLHLVTHADVAPPIVEINAT